MGDIAIHTLLSTGARKYTRLPTLNELVICMSDTFAQIMCENTCEGDSERKSYEILEARKKKLGYALKNCHAGDVSAKQYVKEMIKDILIEKYKVRESNINELISFDNDAKLSDWDKFQILLYVFRKSYDKEALTQMLIQGGLENRRVIRKEDICFLYRQFRPALNFLEKLEIVTQRIYCLYKGLGIADDICEMNIDGLSGGVSGISAENKTLLIFLHDRPINLAFLKFGSERELERICNNICCNSMQKQLSKSRGYIVSDMHDNSRAVAAGPPFCESRVFFVSKLNKSKNRNLKDLYTQENHEMIERFLIFLVKGCQNCAITGSQGSKKTALLMALIEYINPSFNLRVQELAFELRLRNMYQDRNIDTLCETDLLKKADGSVNILVGSTEVPLSGRMLHTGLTAFPSVFTMFTHYAKTTQSLIRAMTDSLLSENIYQSEQEARRRVIEEVRFDIHVGTDEGGKQRIERITEIVPQKNFAAADSLCKIADISGGYYAREIIAFENGKYVKREAITPDLACAIAIWLNDEEKEAFIDEFM